MDKRWGEEYQDFPSKTFCLTLPKNLAGESFSLSKISGIEKCYGKEREGGITIFRRNCFVSQIIQGIAGTRLTSFRSASHLSNHHLPLARSLRSFHRLARLQVIGLSFIIFSFTASFLSTTGNFSMTRLWKQR